MTKRYVQKREDKRPDLYRPYRINEDAPPCDCIDECERHMSSHLCPYKPRGAPPTGVKSDG